MTYLDLTDEEAEAIRDDLGVRVAYLRYDTDGRTLADAEDKALLALYENILKKLGPSDAP